MRIFSERGGDTMNFTFEGVTYHIMKGNSFESVISVIAENVSAHRAAQNKITNLHNTIDINNNSNVGVD